MFHLRRENAPPQKGARFNACNAFDGRIDRHRYEAGLDGTVGFCRGGEMVARIIGLSAQPSYTPAAQLACSRASLNATFRPRHDSLGFIIR
jgi:hypothetical protein